MELLQSIYTAIGIKQTVNFGDLAGISSVLFITIIAIMNSRVSGAKEKPKQDRKIDQAEKLHEEPAKPLEVTWSERLKTGLSRSRSEVWGKLGALLTSSKLDDEKLEKIEELLYGADIGPSMAGEIIDELQEAVTKSDLNSQFEFKKFIYGFIDRKMRQVQSNVDQSLYNFDAASKETKVIMVVGVNGAGKTTTIGKLATKFKEQGATVVVGACDTFRAAAVDQLQVWCDRAGARMIRAKQGANPTGVAYDALQDAINTKANYCILDTAGRLHTKGNLMDELRKTKNVLAKLDKSAPHETLLVIDAITGQNALRQAEEFNGSLGLTGLILTKCDGSSKAGSAIAIVDKLKVPITYIGVGEDVKDLNLFNLNEYLEALLDY